MEAMESSSYFIYLSLLLLDWESVKGQGNIRGKEWTGAATAARIRGLLTVIYAFVFTPS